tara:strand:- start:18568 stop:18855 length:288 start_codon:yes stop_codon:yes gene_type:complete
MIEKRENQRRNIKHNKQKPQGKYTKKDRDAVLVVDMFGKPWRKVAKYKTYEEADKKRKKILRKDGDTLDVKVRLMRKDDTFVVKTRSKFEVVEDE